MIQLSRAPMRKTTSASRRERLRAAPTERAWAVVHHPLAHRRGEEGEAGPLDEGANLVFRPRPRHSLADDDEGALGRLERVEGGLDGFRGGLEARGLGNSRGRGDGVFIDLLADDVVREVEVDSAWPAVDGGPDRLLHEVGDAVGAVHLVGVLAVGGRGHDLALLLESAHAVLIGGGRAADVDHRPGVPLRVGKARKGMDDPRPANGEARPGTAGEIACRLGRVGRGLFVPHPHVGHPFLLGGGGDRLHRESHHPEHVLHALLLEASHE